MPLRLGDLPATRSAAVSTPTARLPTSNIETSFESGLFHSPEAHSSTFAHSNKPAEESKAAGSNTTNGQKRTVSFDVNTSRPSESRNQQSGSLLSDYTAPISDEQEPLTQAALDDPNTFHPLTCWFWRHARCRDSTACELFHFWTGREADHNQSTTYITCPHWLQGSCNRFDACMYAHRVTDYVVGASSVVRRLGQRKPRIGPWTDADVRGKDRPQTDGIGPKKHQTCKYWYDNNACVKPPEQCDFAHDMRPFIARPGRAGPESSAGKRIRLPSGELTEALMPTTKVADTERDQFATGNAASDVQQNTSRRPSRTPSPSPPPVPDAHEQRALEFALPFPLAMADSAHVSAPKVSLQLRAQFSLLTSVAQCLPSTRSQCSFHDLSHRDA